MNLVPYTLTALSRQDIPDTPNNRNVVIGAVVTCQDTTGATVTMFDDAQGTNGSASKQTGANGQVTVFVEPGEYVFSVNGRSNKVVIADFGLRDELAAPDSSVLVGGVEAGQNIIPVASIKDLATAPKIDGRQYSVVGFYAGSPIGGGSFVYDASRSWAEHNGGTVIAVGALQAWGGTQAGVNSYLNWMGSGNGCFVRKDIVTVNTEWFGASNGTTVCQSIRIGKAQSAAETLGVPLEFNGGFTYFFNSTFYIGTCEWITHGCTLLILADSNFTTIGSAARVNEGAFLTKSASGAVSGYPHLRFRFDELNVVFSRPVNNVAGKTAVLFENVESMIGNRLTVKTLEQDSHKCPLDFYQACRNVHIGHVDLFIRNFSKAEGFWIRNCSPTIPTENFKIELLTIDFEGIDEALAIYPFSIGAPGADVRNIVIDKAVIKAKNGNGVSFIDLSGTPYSDTRMAGIVIKDLDLTFWSNRNSPFAVKAEVCAPKIERLRLTVEDISAATGAIRLLRLVRASNQELTFDVDDANIILKGTSPATTDIVGCIGRLVINKLRTETVGAISFSYICQGVTAINSGVIKGNYINYALRDCVFVGRNAEVHGRLEGVQEFHGTLICDTSYKNNAIWFLHSDATRRADLTITFDANVVVTGSGTVDRIILMTGSPPFQPFVDIKARIRNDNLLAIPVDVVGANYQLTQYDVVFVPTNGIPARRSAPKALL